MSLALFLLKERLKMGKIISLIQTSMYLILDNAGSPYKLKFADLMSWLATQTTLSERPMVNFHNNTAFVPSWVHPETLVHHCLFRWSCTTLCVCTHLCNIAVSHQHFCLFYKCGAKLSVSCAPHMLSVLWLINFEDSKHSSLQWS